MHQVGRRFGNFKEHGPSIVGELTPGDSDRVLVMVVRAVIDWSASVTRSWPCNATVDRLFCGREAL